MYKVIVCIALSVTSLHAFAHDTAHVIGDAAHHWFSTHHGAVGLLAIIACAAVCIKKRFVKK